MPVHVRTTSRRHLNSPGGHQDGIWPVAALHLVPDQQWQDAQEQELLRIKRTKGIHGKLKGYTVHRLLAFDTRGLFPLAWEFRRMAP